MPVFMRLDDEIFCVDFLRSPDDPDSVKCILFDMSSLWLEQLPIASVIERENERHPHLGYTEGLIQRTLLATQGANYYLHPLVRDHAGNANEVTRKLNVKYYIAETPVTFEFTLAPATAEELSACLIMPLWRLAVLLDTKNRSLADRLTEKDVEIEQYRTEGAVLKRTGVQTPKFDEQLFDERFPLRMPDWQGLDIQQLLSGTDRRETLLEWLQLVRQPNADTAASRDKGAQRSLATSGPVKRTRKKRKHQRADILCSKLKFPDLPTKPCGTLSVAERCRMAQSDDSD